jgi:hypothetical protein
MYLPFLASEGVGMAFASVMESLAVLNDEREPSDVTIELELEPGGHGELVAT